MDTRLAFLSAAAFAGVLVGGTLIADPSLGNSISPASIWTQATGAFDDDDDEEYGWEDSGATTPMNVAATDANTVTGFDPSSAEQPGYRHGDDDDRYNDDHDDPYDDDHGDGFDDDDHDGDRDDHDRDDDDDDRYDEDGD